MTWLASCGADLRRDGRKIVSSVAKLRLAVGDGRGDAEPWVQSIELVEP